MKKQEAFEKIKTRVLELMETEGSNWTKSWISNQRPINFHTRKHYRGMNHFWLAVQDQFKSCEWGTFKQWSDQGYRIKKGSKACFVVFCEIREKKQEWLEGKELDKYNSTGKLPTFFFWKVYNVFNAEQIEGYDIPVAPEYKEELTQDDADRVNDFISECGPRVHFGFSDTPCYDAYADAIHMPEKDAFFSDVDYYSTLLHELTHWTGHKSRLDRDLDNSYGTEEYAKEELIAEIGSAFLCQLQGVEKTVRADHAQYLNSWMKIIRDDENALSSAFSKAQKAVDYLDSLANKKVCKKVA